MVFYNYVVNGVIVDGPVAYPDVLQRTGLTDQVGLTELGWVEHMPIPEEPEITKAQIDIGIRNLRTHLLQQSDWTQVVDAPLTSAQKAEWATYRQQLRDMPATFASATTIAEIIVPQAPTT
jgi:hypothetical protein